MQELKNYRKKVIAAEPLPPPTTEELLKKATTQQLMVTIIERLLSTQEKTLATLEELRRDIQAGNYGKLIERTLDLQQKPTRKKFVVIGLKPNQANEVRSRFSGHNVDLEFVETEKINKTLPFCDIVFVMTGFVNHSIYSSIKGSDINYVNGGVSGLVNRIHEFVKK
jgi:DNA-directed RNA polymerase subunit F